MRTRTVIIWIVVVLLVIAGFWSFAKKRPAVKESTPAEQGPAEQDIAQNDMVKLFYPLPHGQVSSPLTVRGEAKGPWYFEASFPVKLLDEAGTVLAQTPAMAQGDWMTADFVPFTATLSFPKPATAAGTLVLEKDNPSGLPQNARELRIPVRFAP